MATPTHRIELVNGRSILDVAPLELASRIGAFLSSLPDGWGDNELDECLEPAVTAMLAAGFPPEDVELYRQILADDALAAWVGGAAS
ncbi:hypothetical protein [Azospirillum sp. sgz301742]